jgi:hypothetical protein
MATPAPVVAAAVGLLNDAAEVASDSRWEADRAAGG